MINFISHRGLWNSINNQNSYQSFEEAIKNGFGIETDIRDHNSELIISHDMPQGKGGFITLNNFLEIYKQNKSSLILALNIKADGLSNHLSKSLELFNINNYFVFDMSIPDSLSYYNQSINFYTRQSEHEQKPVLYVESCGVWLDEFNSSWINADILKFHHANRKGICIVSPELHGRDHKSRWKEYKKIVYDNPEIDINLCTDYPLEARSYFE